MTEVVGIVCRSARRPRRGVTPSYDWRRSGRLEIRSPGRLCMQSRQSPQQGGDVVDLRDYIAVLRRRSLVITVLALLGLGLALGYSKLQTPIYTATAKILINPPPGDTSQNLNNVISVDTEAQVVKSAPDRHRRRGRDADGHHPDAAPQARLGQVDREHVHPGHLLLGPKSGRRPRWGPTRSRRPTSNTSRQQGADQIQQQESSIENQIDRAPTREQDRQNRILERASRGRSPTATPRTRSTS